MGEDVKVGKIGYAGQFDYGDIYDRLKAEG